MIGLEDRNKKRIRTFLLGGLCFIVSQVLLRMPILNYLQGTSRFNLFYTLNPLLTGILIAFSAGIFEEGFRYIFKKNLLRPTKTNILEPILFGLGHGLTEALILLLPAFFIYSLGDLKLPILERILAIILHIGLSVIVWNGFQLDRRMSYLLLAIAVHGLTNSLIPILSGYDNFIVLIEGSFLIIDIVLIAYIYRSRKLYILEEEIR